MGSWNKSTHIHTHTADKLKCNHYFWKLTLQQGRAMGSNTQMWLGVLRQKPRVSLRLGYGESIDWRKQTVEYRHNRVRSCLIGTTESHNPTTWAMELELAATNADTGAETGSRRSWEGLECLEMHLFISQNNKTFTEYQEILLGQFVKLKFFVLFLNKMY